MRNDYCPECGHLLSRKGVVCRFCGNYDNSLVNFNIYMDAELAEPIVETSDISHIEKYVFGSKPGRFNEA